MSNKDRMDILQLLSEGGWNVGNIIIEMNGDIHQSFGDNEKSRQRDGEGVRLGILQKAATKVKEYFWGTSSYAVIFCACRDYYGYPDNMSQFERDFNCAPGTIASTFKNNKYMKLPIEKWQFNGAKERALILARMYQMKVSDELPEEEPSE